MAIIRKSSRDDSKKKSRSGGGGGQRTGGGSGGRHVGGSGGSRNAGGDSEKARLAGGGLRRVDLDAGSGIIGIITGGTNRSGANRRGVGRRNTGSLFDADGGGRRNPGGGVGDINAVLDGAEGINVGGVRRGTDGRAANSRRGSAFPDIDRLKGGIARNVGIGVRDGIISFVRDHSFFFRISMRRAIDKDFDGALKYIEKALEMDPYNADYLFNKACLLVELERIRESVKMLNYITCKVDPTYTICYFGLGCNYFELGNIELALHYFEKYVLLEEEGEFAEDAYDFLYHMQYFEENGTEIEDEDDFDADRQYEITELSQKRFHNASAKLHAIGSMYMQRGNYKEAIRQFERSILACPEITSSRIRLSMSYYMTGQVKFAKLLADSVLKIHKSNHMAKLCLALYHSVDGDTRVTEKLLNAFDHAKGKKKHSQQEHEDHVFYGRMLKQAPINDILKGRLQDAATKLCVTIR